MFSRKGKSSLLLWDDDAIAAAEEAPQGWEIDIALGFTFQTLKSSASGPSIAGTGSIQSLGKIDFTFQVKRGYICSRFICFSMQHLQEFL